MAEVVRDVRLRYPTPGFPLPYGECRLRALRLEDGRTVAVVTEVDDNPGASVTNAAESVHAAVQGHGYDAVIEHYPPASHRDSTLDEVLITPVTGRARWRYVDQPTRGELLAVLEPEREEAGR